MKQAIQFLVMSASLALLTAPLSAQNYNIDWYKVAGGGVSANAQFVLNGTVGQPDAGGPMSSGQFSLTGGYWVLPQAVQTAGAPTLAITPGISGHAIISWTPNTPGYVLQETWSLSSSNWTNSASGAANPVTVPAVPTSKFFRLVRP